MGQRQRQIRIVEERELSGDHNPLTVVEGDTRRLTDPRVPSTEQACSHAGAFCPQSPSRDSPSCHPTSAQRCLDPRPALPELPPSSVPPRPSAKHSQWQEGLSSEQHQGGRPSVPGKAVTC